MVATQNVVKDSDISLAMALLVFGQNFFGAAFLVIANTIYDQSLISEIPRRAPPVSPQAALSAGGSASAVRSLLPEGSPELHGLLQADSIRMDRIFYFSAALAVASFFVAWGLGWKNVAAKKHAAQE